MKRKNQEGRSWDYDNHRKDEVRQKTTGLGKEIYKRCKGVLVGVTEDLRKQNYIENAFSTAPHSAAILLNPETA